MDFSEEVPEVHFLGKQYSLHCSIVQPGDDKFAYHLSDDTTHGPSFVHQVLEDIFHCTYTVQKQVRSPIIYFFSKQVRRSYHMAIWSSRSRKG